MFAAPAAMSPVTPIPAAAAAAASHSRGCRHSRERHAHRHGSGSRDRVHYHGRSSSSSSSSSSGSGGRPHYTSSRHGNRSRSRSRSCSCAGIRIPNGPVPSAAASVPNAPRGTLPTGPLVRNQVPPRLRLPSDTAPGNRLGLLGARRSHLPLSIRFRFFLRRPAGVAVITIPSLEKQDSDQVVILASCLESRARIRLFRSSEDGS
jgi:hypothetical protein